jgi:hypothetical protein
MNKFVLIHIILLTIFSNAVAQKADRIVKVPLLRYERSFGVNLNSDGWGFGYRHSKAKSFTVKKSWDFSFNFVRDSKQFRYYNQADNSSKSFFYGKQINFYNLQVMRGRQKKLTDKPYWGGVELRYFYYGGINIGIAKPIYLYIIDYANGNALSLQRYDVQKHDLDNIWGRGPFSKGLSELTIHPGLSFKSGLNVEFGSFQEKTLSLEAGAVIDVFANSVQIMGFDNPTNYMLRLYVAFRFGKRFDSVN